MDSTRSQTSTPDVDSETKVYEQGHLSPVSHDVPPSCIPLSFLVPLLGPLSDLYHSLYYLFSDNSQLPYNHLYPSLYLQSHLSTSPISTVSLLFKLSNS